MAHQLSHHRRYDAIPEADGKYLLINVVTRRAKDLLRHGKPTIPYAEGNFDAIDVAVEELEHNKLAVRSRNKAGEIEKYEDME